MRNLILSVCIACCCACNSGDTTSSETNNDAKGDSFINKKKDNTENVDALTHSPANFRLLLENEYVRVLEYTLEPGKKDEWHTHPPKTSYVVSGGKLRVYLANGKIVADDDETGTVKWMNYVGKHYVENVGTTTVKVILTEIKSLQ